MGRGTQGRLRRLLLNMNLSVTGAFDCGYNGRFERSRRPDCFHSYFSRFVSFFPLLSDHPWPPSRMNVPKMQSTTRFEPNPTITAEGTPGAKSDPKLLAAYERLGKSGKVSWTGHHHMLRLLGRGGQGEVYLTEYRGTDGFTVPVAMKIFSPERYNGSAAYDEAMQRVASIAARVALIQHDNLLDVQNFFERHRVRIMMMEWVDGYDLRQLMAPRCLHLLHGHVSSRRWRYINEVILTEGPEQSRFKAGVAVAIVREMSGGFGRPASRRHCPWRR